MYRSAILAAALVIGSAAIATAEVQVQTAADGSMVMENEFLKLTISPVGARIVSLQDKLSGREEVKTLPYIAGLNIFRYGRGLNFNDMSSRFTLSVRQDAPGLPTGAGSKTVRAEAKLLATEESPDKATYAKEYTLSEGSSCIRVAFVMANDGAEEISLFPWVQHLMRRGLKADPEEAYMTEHGAFLRGHLAPGKPASMKLYDYHFFPAANWTSRVVLPVEDGSDLLATVLKPKDMLKIYNWHRGLEDYCSQEFIMAPKFAKPGQSARWDYAMILTAPVRNAVYCSPDLVIGASPHPTGIAAGVKELELSFSATSDLPMLHVKGRLTTVDNPGKALREYAFDLDGLSPRKIVSRKVPVELQEKTNYQVHLSFFKGEAPYFPGAAVDDRDEVLIPLVVGTEDTAQVVFPTRSEGAKELRRIEPRKLTATRVSSADALDAFAFPAGEHCFRQDSFEAKGQGPVQLYACAGEYESAQVVLVPKAAGRKTYQVTVSDLAGPEGQAIACESVNEFIYVPTHIPSAYNAQYAIGEYPEALLPVQSVTIGDEKNHPIFLTWRIPSEAKPGIYRGVIRLVSDADRLEVPVEMKVWNVVLPLRSKWMDTPTSLKGEGWAGAKDKDGKPLSRAEQLRMIEDIHLKYRLTPCDAGITANLLALKFDAFEPVMRRYVAEGATKIYLGSVRQLLQEAAPSKKAAAGPPVASEVRVAQIEAYLRDKGWLDYFYVRAGFDEASPDLIPKIRAECERWKKVSRIPIMETYYHEEPKDLYGMLDIWSRSVSDAPWIKARMAAGDRFWRVNAFPGYVEPEPWLIRKTYLGLFDYGFTGTYIWTVKQWQGVTKWGEDYWCDGGVGNLSAVLMWPHETTILSTIRLEALRDAIEDNALFWMLREKVNSLEGKPETEALKKARALVTGERISKRIAAESDLERLRIEAGDALSALNTAEQGK